MTSFTSRYGNPAVEFGSARLWAHERHGCVVVAAVGRIDARNLADVTAYAGRYITRGAAFVLDLSRVTVFTAGAAPLPQTIDEQCSAAGVDWALVGSEPVLRRLGDRAMPLIDSVAHAEHHFDDAVTARRRMLLPLLGRTA
jgi:anti-anti-sigma regulatory factor